MLLSGLLTLAANGVHAQYAGRDNGKPDIIERNASIRINGDNSITVTETTLVGRVAPLPFHRDLALGNRNWSAGNVTVLSATENGDPVSTQVDDHDGGARISVGSTGASGTRKYELVYRVDHAVLHYEDQDRLDWPVVSRSNPLELEEAVVRVTLPEGTPPRRTLAWFRLGDVDPSWHPEAQVRDNNDVLLYWPSGLAAEAALSVAVTYPNGGAAAVQGGAAATSPGTAGMPRFMFDGRAWLALLAAYYLCVKFLFTAGTRRKAVIPEYGPPKGYSAAALRLLWRKGYDEKCLATGILGIAAKGGLAISQQADGTYVATSVGEEVIPALTIDEHTLRSSLFTLAPSIEFTPANADSMDLVETRFRTLLEYRCARDQPAGLDMLLLPGWAIALTAVVLLYFGGDDPLRLAAQLIAATMVVFVALVILVRLVPRGLLRAIRLQAILAAMICVAAWATGSGIADGSWIAALLAVQVFAGWWLPRQPSRDTELVRKMRGFRWYLGVAEQQDMDARYKPSLHPELQASFLPYAMALDVEVAWNKRFAGTLQKNDREDFLARLDRDRPGHVAAALDLMAFCRAMSKSRQPEA